MRPVLLPLSVGSQPVLLRAVPLLERALAIREKVLEPDHPETARSRNNLAELLWDQGEPAAARPLYERALAISESMEGPAARAKIVGCAITPR